MLIDGISALVTGGASGLGLATAKELVERGAFVTIVDLPVSDGAAVAKELGDRVRFAPADITSEEEVRSAIAAAEQARCGRWCTARDAAETVLASSTRSTNLDRLRRSSRY